MSAKKNKESVVLPTFEFEHRRWAEGFCRLAGIDGAGLGPLAGPVVAVAVILPERFDLPGLNDSKKLTAKKREKLAPLIARQALAVGVGVVSPGRIDEINIRQADLEAMRLAVGNMGIAPDFLLVDGNREVPGEIPQETIVKGDAKSLSIAAASIIAKVVRDKMMVIADRRYPGYDLGKHKGYGTKVHREAIKQLGPCPIHRMTFAGVKEFVK